MEQISTGFVKKRADIGVTGENMYNPKIVSSEFAPGGIPAIEETNTLGAIDLSVARTTLENFLKAGGAAAAETLLNVPEIKEQVTALGVETAKAVEKSKMQQAFDKVYTFYDTHRIPIYVGIGVTGLGASILVMRKLFGKGK